MSALPKTDSPQVQDMAKEDANYLSAYEVCLQYEESATNANQLRHVRILGFLLLNAPSRGVRSEVTKCIHSRKDDAGLFHLGAFFERYFIVPCEFPVCHFYSLLRAPIFTSVQSRSIKDEHRNPAITRQDPLSRSLEIRLKSTLGRPPRITRVPKIAYVNDCRRPCFSDLIPHLQGSHSRQLEMCRDEYRSLGCP